MSYTATVIEILLSSPDDVNVEREYIVAYAGEWNRLRGRSTGCYLSVLTWESLVAPALGVRVQEVANKRIGSSYDVYLGMFWAKAGTPTGRADSGTIEEFDLALNRVRIGESVWIATLFKRASIDPQGVDASQLLKVQSFKERASTEGVFYREFSDESSLRSILSLLFEQIASETGANQRSADDPVPASSSVSSNVAAAHDVASELTGEEDDIGLIEVGEEFSRLADELMEKLKELGSEEERNNLVLSETSAEIATLVKFGSIDESSVKRLFNKAADSMNELAGTIEARIDTVEDLMDRMARLADEDLRIRLDFDDPAESAATNLAELKNLSVIVKEAVTQFDGLIEATQGLPRMSTNIAKVKTKLVKLRSRLRSSFISFGESLDNSISFFEGRS